MRRPSRLRALAEPVRAAGELATSMSLLSLLPLLPKGDGHPVLVLPGFMAGDRSTWVLRSTLAGRGYEVHPWGLGRNLGPTEAIVRGLPDVLRDIHAAYGRSVTIVGQSLGGVYGRVLARNWPETVRSVVTLGTPVRVGTREASNAQPLFDRLRGIHHPGIAGLDDGMPLPVPVTALHSATDGIVDWEACLVQPAPNAENIRVFGSHTGMGVNPAAVYVVADRLAQPDGTWRPFRVPRGATGLLSVVDGAAPADSAP